MCLWLAKETSLGFHFQKEKVSNCLLQRNETGVWLQKLHKLWTVKNKNNTTVIVFHRVSWLWFHFWFPLMWDKDRKFRLTLCCVNLSPFIYRGPGSDWVLGTPCLLYKVTWWDALWDENAKTKIRCMHDMYKNYTRRTYFIFVFGSVVFHCIQL